MPSTHTVVQGECLTSIAARHGFADHTALYDHPDNAALRRRRPNPNVIHPGDEVVIPDRPPKQVSLATGKVHRIVIKRPRALLRLQVPVYEPHRYTLTVAGETFTGQTDGQAPIEHPIPADAAVGRIELVPASGGAPLAWELALGHLDPVEELSGVQGRLANLGIYAGPIDGQPGDDLALAVAAFQAAEGLEVTGDPEDAAMRARLRERHDGG